MSGDMTPKPLSAAQQRYADALVATQTLIEKHAEMGLKLSELALALAQHSLWPEAYRGAPDENTLLAEAAERNGGNCPHGKRFGEASHECCPWSRVRAVWYGADASMGWRAVTPTAQARDAAKARERARVELTWQHADGTSEQRTVPASEVPDALWEHRFNAANK